ncbi:MAG: Hsp33 family molecular chaperone HslO [Burkholderiaceae bacterium]
MSDTLRKFVIEGASVRGELVELPDAWREILSHRNDPPPVRALLGDMVAAAALLSANLKFNGSLVMQIFGDGPVRLLVVECDAELRLRATAKLVDDAAVPDNATLTELVNAHGNGRFAITLDPHEKLPGQQPYQGIVPLDGDDMATVIEHYMLRSEQLETRLWLAADENVARGLLLQKLPQQGGTAPQQGTEDAEEAWNRVAMLGGTLKREELLSTDIETLLRRLFWEETVRVFEPQHPQFQCSCSREKVGNMLKMLGQEEVNSALAELGSLEIDCDFCGQQYEFDAVDCAQLFATHDIGDMVQPAGKARH